MTLNPIEQARVAEIAAELEALEVVVDVDDQGPYGRTLQAIREYRDNYWDPLRSDIFRDQQREPLHPDDQRCLDLLAELICLYAVGIVRGDGEGIASPYADAAAATDALTDAIRKGKTV